MQTARGGTNVTLTASVSGSGPIFYQWYFNGGRLLEATNAALLLANVQPGNSGYYNVVVISPYGAQTSESAHLMVLTPPAITSPPTNVLARLSSPSATTNVSFRVTAAGSGPVSYQWFHNGSPISGGTNALLTLSNATPAAAGTYTVEVSDAGGWSLASATLTIWVVPFILEHPQSHVAVVGDTVTFRVKAVGTEPLAYRWRSNTTQLGVYSPSPVLTITNVKTNHAANYTVIVTNVASSTVLSRAGTLTVLADTDGDHAPDVWESANGFNPADANDIDGDADGDSMSNLAEYIAGTDPHDDQSYFKVDTISRVGSALLTFLARSNRTYTVQYNSELSPSGWSNLINVPFVTNSHVETVSDPSPAPGRLYRLVTPGQ
jgi:archaellum component FlaG (FlaF/FlaG flagellin family)